MPFSRVSLDEFLKQAVTNVITILTQPLPLVILSLKAGDVTQNALLDLAKVIKRVKPILELILLMNKKELLQLVY